MQSDCFPQAITDWSREPLSRLAEINPRYPVTKGRRYPFVEMANVGENFGGILTLGSRAYDASGLSRFSAGDTLFAKITPCPENGKVAFVSHLPDEMGIGSTEFIVLSPRPGTDPRFLYHLVCCHSVRGRATARMEGSTGRQRVPDDVFRKRLRVPTPDLPEQRAIASLLDAVAMASDRARAELEQAQNLERSLLEEAFARLSAQNHRLGEFTREIRYGTSRASSDRGWGVPVLRIPNVIADRLELADLAHVELPPSEVTGLQLVDGDLLLVRTNGNPNYVGRSAVFRAPDARTWVFASYLIRVRFKERVLPEFVNAYLGLERGRRELLRRVTTSAGNHNINTHSIRLLTLPVPDTLEPQQDIVRLANVCRARVDAVRLKADALDNVKTSLMEDLLAGRTRVPMELALATR